MILLSRDALQDVERVRTFLDRANPDAARRALELIWTTIERLRDFPSLGTATEDFDIRQLVIRLAYQAISCVMLFFPTRETFSSRESGMDAKPVCERARPYSFLATAVSLVRFCSKIRPRCRSRMPSLRQS